MSGEAFLWGSNCVTWGATCDKQVATNKLCQTSCDKQADAQTDKAFLGAGYCDHL